MNIAICGYDQTKMEQVAQGVWMCPECGNMVPEFVDIDPIQLSHDGKYIKYMTQGEPE